MAKRDLTGAIDFDHLRHFAGGDAALIDEVLGLFREQAEVWMRLLDPHGADQGWRDAAHSLKGSALAVGAIALADACKAAEAAGDAGAVERERLLGDIRHALNLTLADIAAHDHEQALQSLRG